MKFNDALHKYVLIIDGDILWEQRIPHLNLFYVDILKKMVYGSDVEYISTNVKSIFTKNKYIYIFELWEKEMKKSRF